MKSLHVRQLILFLSLARSFALLMLQFPTFLCVCAMRNEMKRTLNFTNTYFFLIFMTIHHITVTNTSYKYQLQIQYLSFISSLIKLDSISIKLEKLDSI